MQQMTFVFSVFLYCRIVCIIPDNYVIVNLGCFLPTYLRLESECQKNSEIF
ncbi:hypothetical protein SSSM7_004 [Synechococcus phage S-SSM7]|uniref:Uncharacterized protein n=1 Tax=Synechococcus phage S-SSM7 TaxID=445686 RepID=E3SKS1_9CAUD|nr:hypothetical protein SSSM7_004 [Synechococcus phage S-SSM7]ADO98069.1 hypothetical protein SSSM7_004 [Synechococcus phage S-SSM7]